MIYYCDSSALVKIYLEESGSTFMRNLRRNAKIGNILINLIAGPEVLSALNRRFRTGDLTADVLAEARKDFGRDFVEFFSRHPVSDSIIQLAMHLSSSHTAEAIHQRSPS